MTIDVTRVLPDVQQALDRLVADLEAAAGDTLRGVALYGGLAKGRFTKGISDINVLVVISDSGLATLERIAPVLTGARRESRISALVTTPADLLEMARLFPVKIADIQGAHRVLHGDVSISEIEIDPAAMRLRAGQEMSNSELRFRQRVVEHAGDVEAMWAGVMSDLPKLAVTLETLLRLRGADQPADRAGVLRRAGDSLGLPRDLINRFAALHRTDERPADDVVRAVAFDWLRLLALLRTRIAADGGPQGDTAPLKVSGMRRGGTGRGSGTPPGTPSD